MAMSMRSRGLAGSTNRPRISVRPVYEDFNPLIESKEDPEAHTVYIHLPGFLKEHIRIMAESSRGLLRVRGERLVAGNTWSRFLEEVPVPENCGITETRAKFEGGVLRITMPKRITSVASQSSSPADEATTPERSPPALPRPAPPPHPVQSRPVAPPPSQPASTPRPLPPVAEPRPEALRPPRTPVAEPRSEALHPPRTPVAEPRPEALRPPRTAEPRLTPSIQPNPRDDAKPKQSPPLPPRPTPPPHPEAARLTPSIHQKPTEDEKTKFGSYQKPLLPAEKSTPPGLLQALPQPDPISSERWRTKSKAPVTSGAPTAAEALKRYESLTEDEKHAMKGMSVRRLEEDRKLLVNMGAAAMVIFALGAWISYSFGSPANSSN